MVAAGLSFGGKSDSQDFGGMSDEDLVQWILERRSKLGIPLADGVSVNTDYIGEYAKWLKNLGPARCEGVCSMSEGDSPLTAYFDKGYKSIVLFRDTFIGATDVTSEYYSSPENPGRLTTSYLGDVTREKQAVFVLGHEGAHTIGIDAQPGPYQHSNANYYGLRALQNFRRIYGKGN